MQDEKPLPEHTPPPGEAPETEAPESEESAIDRLTGIIATLEAEKAELREQALRALAEAQNTRRRLERERDEAIKYASIPLLRDLVPAADNLARALAALPPELLEGNEAARSLQEGVAMTERTLLAALQKHGVQKIEPLGQPLDPNLHEAMFEVPTAEAAPGTVVQVLEAGWKQNDRLIRPARVGVAKAP